MSKSRFFFLLVCVIIFFTLMVACSPNVESLSYIDQSKPFKLLYVPTGSPELSDIKNVDILPGSDKYKKFISWLENNSEAWQRQPSLLSYNLEMQVSQENFTLIVTGTTAILILTEGGTKSLYVKDLKQNEFYFLIEDLYG